MVQRSINPRFCLAKKSDEISSAVRHKRHCAQHLSSSVAQHHGNLAPAQAHVSITMQLMQPKEHDHFQGNICSSDQ